MAAFIGSATSIRTIRFYRTARGFSNLVILSGDFPLASEWEGEVEGPGVPICLCRSVKAHYSQNKKRQGRPPAVQTQRLVLLAAVDRFPELGSGRKLCYFAGSDLNGGARLRIAPVAGFSLRDREGAKTN